MKCHEVQSKIAQIDDDSPAAEIIVHARECAACNQSLREMLWQQKWLRERFAEVSEQLLAHAPPLWGAAFQERLKGPALPAPLLPVAWTAVLLGAAVLGWWTWTSSTTSSSKSSVAERHALRESADRQTASANHRAHSKPIPSLSEFESLGSASSSWPAETGPVWTLPEQSACRTSSPELAVCSLYRSLTYRKVITGAGPGCHRHRLRVGAVATCHASFRHRCVSNGTDCLHQALKVTWLRSFRRQYRSNDRHGGAEPHRCRQNRFSRSHQRRRRESSLVRVGRTDINGSAVAVMLRSSPTTAAVGA